MNLSFFSTIYISSPKTIQERLVNWSNRCFYLGGKRCCVRNSKISEDDTASCSWWELAFKISIYLTSVWGALASFRREKLSKTKKNIKRFGQVICSSTVLALAMKTFSYFSYWGIEVEPKSSSGPTPSSPPNASPKSSSALHPESSNIPLLLQDFLELAELKEELIYQELLYNRGKVIENKAPACLKKVNKKISELKRRTKKIAQSLGEGKTDFVETIDAPSLFCLLVGSKDECQANIISQAKKWIDKIFQSSCDEQWESLFKLFFYFELLSIDIPEGLKLSSWLPERKNEADYAKAVAYAKALVNQVYKPQEPFFYDFILKIKQDFTMKLEKVTDIQVINNTATRVTKDCLLEHKANTALYMAACPKEKGLPKRKRGKKPSVHFSLDTRMASLNESIAAFEKRVKELEKRMSKKEVSKEIMKDYGERLPCMCADIVEHLDSCSQFDKELLVQLEHHCQFLRKYFLDQSTLQILKEKLDLQVFEVLLYAGPPCYSQERDECGNSLLFPKDDKQYDMLMDELFNEVKDKYKDNSESFDYFLIKMCLNRMKRLPLHKKVSSIREKGSRDLFPNYKRFITYLMDQDYQDSRMQNAGLAYDQVTGFQLDLSDDVYSDFVSEAKFRFVHRHYRKCQEDKCSSSHEELRWILRCLKEYVSEGLILTLQNYFQPLLYESYKKEWEGLKDQGESGLEAIYQFYLQFIEDKEKVYIEDTDNLEAALKTHIMTPRNMKILGITRDVCKRQG